MKYGTDLEVGVGSKSVPEQAKVRLGMMTADDLRLRIRFIVPEDVATVFVVAAAFFHSRNVGHGRGLLQLLLGRFGRRRVVRPRRAGEQRRRRHRVRRLQKLRKERVGIISPRLFY